MRKIYEIANAFIPAARWLHVLYGWLSCLTFAAFPKPTFLYSYFQVQVCLVTIHGRNILRLGGRQGGARPGLQGGLKGL